MATPSQLDGTVREYIIRWLRDCQPLVQAPLAPVRGAITIHDLPNEVLCLIFLEAVDFEDRFDRESVRKADIATVINIAQVCVRWRAVVLQSGALWSMVLDVEGQNDGWFQEVIGRTGPFAALSFLSQPYRRPIKAIRETVKGHIDRCEYLRLPVGWPQDDYTEWSRWLLARPAPRLKKCVIIHDFHSEFAYNFALRFPDYLFHGHAPELRSLTLTNCCLPLPNRPNLFPKLNELVIQYSRSVDITVLLGRKSVSAMVSFLSSFPKLRRITLEDSLEDTISHHQYDVLRQVKPVTMDFLESFCFTGDATVALELCSRVLMPAMTTVRLQLRFTNARVITTDEYVQTMKGIIDLMMKDSRGEEYLRVVFTPRNWTIGLGDDGNRVRFEVDITTSTIWLRDRPFARDPGLEHSAMAWDSPFCWLVDYLSQDHPLVIREIRSLSLEFKEIGYSFYHCRRILRAMEALDTLCLRVPSLGILERATTTWLEDEDVIFPLLRKLELHVRSLRSPTTLAAIPAFVSAWEAAKSNFKSFVLVLPSIDDAILVTRGGETFGWECAAEVGDVIDWLRKLSLDEVKIKWHLD